MSATKVRPPVIRSLILSVPPFIITGTERDPHLSLACIQIFGIFVVF
jgi:hypothetical protein